MNINRVPEEQNGLFPRELVSVILECAGDNRYAKYFKIEEVIKRHPRLDYQSRGISLDEYLKKYSHYLEFNRFRRNEVGIRVRKNINPSIRMSIDDGKTLWAYVNDSKYHDLELLARKEVWSLDENEPYTILKSYLNVTFKRLASQKRILIDRNTEDAVFNTGLITNTDDYIYAHFRMNSEDEFDPVCWRLDSFITKEMGTYEYLRGVFGENFPSEPADYFYDYDTSTGSVVKKSNIRNFVYIPDESEHIPNWKHICLDNIGRFPYSYLKALVSQNSELNETLDNVYYLNEENYNRKLFMSKLAGVLSQDELLYASFKNCVDTAMKHTFNLAKRNYKIVVPTYYPKEDTVNMLFPLWLENTNKSPDLALVVLRGEDNTLKAKTILSMSMAYTDSRVIAPVDTAWLLSYLK